MNKVIYTGGLLLCLLALGGCRSNSESDHRHEHETEGEHEHEGHGDEIIFHKEKAEAAGIEVSTVKSGTFYQVLQTSGEIMAAQGDEKTLVASVSGIVSFQTKIVEGMKVGAGSMLLRLSSNNIADGDPVQKAKVAYETSQKEFNRMQVLVKSKIVSEKEFNTARQNYETAKISYESLASGHSRYGQAIQAPLSGYIKNILVKEGDYVSTGQPLMQISQNRRLFLKAEISEKDYAHLPHITTARFKTAYSPKIYSLNELNGKLLSFGKSTNGSSYFIPVTFEFDNRGDVVPGSYVEVYLQSSPIENTIAIPRSALTEEQGIYYVYLQLDEEGYAKQEVTLGTDNGEFVQITSGLKNGDRLVTKGAMHIKLASASNAIPAHSHEH